MLASAGSVDAVRHELGNLVRNQRALAGQLSDVLKAVELSVGRMQEVFEEQKQATRLLRGNRAEAPAQRAD